MECNADPEEMVDMVQDYAPIKTKLPDGRRGWIYRSEDKLYLEIRGEDKPIVFERAVLERTSGLGRSSGVWKRVTPREG